MREKIYTIPVNEAFDADCECALCYLHNQLEMRYVEDALGAGMMEPDNRIVSNEKGFCNKHFSLLFSLQNKLPLALVLETHLEATRKKLDCFMGKAKRVSGQSKSLFKRSSDVEGLVKDIKSVLDGLENSCVICDKINDVLERYIDVTLYLWETENEFRKKFDNSKGFCLVHYKMLAEGSLRYLKGNSVGDFLNTLYFKQQESLSRLQEQIHHFTLKFDYRNKDMPWGNAKDAPMRTIEKLVGQIEK